MKKILSLIVLLLFLTGCGITGKVVEEVKEQSTQEEKDSVDLYRAMAEKDVSVCYSIQTQPVREECFIKLAEELKDPSICDNLLGKSLKDSCKENIE